MNIVIIGFMGTGKTVVAKALAKELKKDYVSMDNVIEKKEGKSISDIFAQKGEPYFRNVEKEVAKELSEKDGLIIDAGGGVVLNEENIKNLKNNGKIICLTATIDVIFERTKRHTHRPLLNVEDPKKKIKELFDFRTPYYKKADHEIDTSKKSIREIVKEIVEVVGSR